VTQARIRRDGPYALGATAPSDETTRHPRGTATAVNERDGVATAP
jgi:hypothetical protein